MITTRDHEEQFRRNAFEYEREAAYCAPFEPARSRLFRSAATLARDAGQPDEARRLALAGLTGTPPVEIAEELRELLGELERSAQWE